jgi:cellulose biosynthesis protein BcsQ
MEERGIKHVVIDTGNSADAIRYALEATDHLVIPMAPSGVEAPRLRATLEAAAHIAAHKNIKVSILLTRTIHGTRSRAESKAALEGVFGTAGVNILETEVPRLERFATAYGTAPTNLYPYNVALDELHAIDERN